jgi:hypothetical protein
MKVSKRVIMLVHRILRLICGSMMPRLLGALSIIFIATSAQAEPWYLMAPNKSHMDKPMSAHELEQRGENSLLTLISQATFSSESDCLVARQNLMQEWRDQGSLSAQQFRQWGGPYGFFLCTPSSDPKLKKAPDGVHWVRKSEVQP